jgi:ATP-dependent Lon protease
MDFRGDPSSALLEVLDPEQNSTFVDHYLDVEYDLSKVLFIATANVAHTIPPPLRDRMEVIELSGYTPNEKLAIAEGFLVPKQLESHGLAKRGLTFSEAGLQKIIESHTREAGVRNLERQIGAVCRKLARRLVEDGRKAAKDGTAGKDSRKKKSGKKRNIDLEVTPEVVQELLGKDKYRPRRALDEAEIGVATGLAWTEAGGELLESEVSLMKGKGKLILTGKLGDVMQESARAALSYLRSRASLLNIDPGFNEECDIHIHVPEGAIPKDGPSAGITMATALISAISDRAVRRNVAMTGEITLRGKVLPVGGIKDKTLAAFRAGINEVILPRENEKDLEEIPAEIRDAMRIHLVDSMDQVLRIAFEEDLPRLPQVKPEQGDQAGEGPAGSGPVAH